MQKPGIWNIDIYVGADFVEVFRFKTEGVPVVLTGYSVFCQLRESQDINSLLLADFTAAVTDENTGEITISLTDTQTKALADMINQTAAYSIVLRDPSNVDLPFVVGDANIHGLTTDVGA